MRSLRTLLLLPSLLPGIAAFPQQYNFQNFSLENGLPGSTVTCMQEDLFGFLWIGTDGGGMARTDGRHFITYDERTGLGSDNVHCIAMDSAGIVWVGQGPNGISRISPDSLQVLGPAERMPNAPITAIVTRKDGRYAATRGSGIIKDFDTRPVVIGTAHGLPHANVNDLITGPLGDLWAATDSGLARMHGGNWMVFHEQEGLPSSRILCLSKDSTRLYIGTDRGVSVWENGRFHEMQLDGMDAHVQCILRDDRNELWIGTANGLIRIHPDGRVQRLNERNGLSDADVRCLYQDRSGAIWAGTAFGGVSKFTSDAFVHFNVNSGLTENIVSAMQRAPDGSLWFGTFGGGVAQQHAGIGRIFNADRGLQDDRINALHIFGNKVLVASEGGLDLIHPNGNVERMINGRSIRSLLPLDSGRAMAGGANGWVLVDTYGKARIVDLWSRPEVHVNGMAMADGVIWSATSAGLFRHGPEQGTPEQVHIKDLPTGSLTSIAASGSGELWVGTATHGLLRIMGERMEIFTTDDGLSNDQITLVMLDPFENVWVGTRRGIDMLELDVLQEFVLDIDNYITLDGFIGMEVFRNAGWIDTDSSLWFGTTQGATNYNAHRLLRDDKEPITRILSVQQLYEDMDWGRWSKGTDPHTGLGINTSLRYDHNHLTFEFAGISLAFPEKVRYQFILEGYDPEWSPITDQDKVTYSNIPPGTYTFKVIARNASGVWNQTPVTFSFTIRPPYWRTNGFILGSIALLALLIFLFIRSRTRRLRRDRDRLEGMVQVRTRELEAEKDRSDELLLNILPEETAVELIEHGKAETRSYDQCSVLFSDFQGFTILSEQLGSNTLVAELDKCFRAFDRITDKYHVEKIKTIGDAYMCAGGLPRARPMHALNTVLMAMEMVEVMRAMNADREKLGLPVWHIRIGIHTGPLIAGVVGEKKFAYDIWGDTVNIASRMESNSAPGHINISGATYAQVMDFILGTARGPMKVKNKGEMQMYFVERIRPAYSADEEGLVPNDKLWHVLGALEHSVVM